MPLRSFAPRSSKLEEIAEQPARALGDDDHVRFGDRLQPRREVRRLADDAALLRLPRSDEVADDDQPGRDADPHVQRRTGRGDEFRRSLDDGEPGLHGALGVMFVGLGIAEIGEHAVAHVFGDEAAVALDQRRAAAMIGADDLAHILGIEPRRHRGRADEVAEHHGELTALGDGVEALVRGSAASRPGGARRTKRIVPRSPSTSCADRRRWRRRVSFRSSAVSCGRTSPSILFSRNAASYCPRPRPRSHHRCPWSHPNRTRARQWSN